jgi:hypothetical protein
VVNIPAWRSASRGFNSLRQAMRFSKHKIHSHSPRPTQVNSMTDKDQLSNKHIAYSDNMLVWCHTMHTASKNPLEYPKE